MAAHIVVKDGILIIIFKCGNVEIYNNKLLTQVIDKAQFKLKLCDDTNTIVTATPIFLLSSSIKFQNYVGQYLGKLSSSYISKLWL